jgi:hypothetical protein
VALAVDARMPTVVALPIDAGQCVDAIAVPDDDVALLDLEAFDDAGRSVGRAKDGPGPRALVVCSSLQLAGTLALRPHVGRGLAAIVVSRSSGATEHASAPPPDALWVATSQPIARATAAREGSLVRDGYGAATFKSVGGLALGHRVAIAMDLGATSGTCQRVDVVAGAPLAIVDARIWSDAGPLIASSEASASTTLFACAHGAARLELQTRGRPGPYALTVRPERWKGAAMTTHPLAASRMLARAAAGPDALFDGKELALRELSLDAERLVAWSETIAAGACLRATIGAQGEGAGVEVRVFDVDGSEIDRSESAHAAGVRACAGPEAARTVKIEVRASAGRMDAVLGERLGPN